MRRFAALCGLILLLASGVARGAVSAPPDHALKDRIWQDESIYFIFLDRFHNADIQNDDGVNLGDPKAWHGGDLQGVINKLDYIKSLGFTALWITPHVKNAGRDYHGYGAVDFFAVDPHFGTLATAKELVDKAHARGVKVIFDIVVNHTGPMHPLVRERPDWFHPKRGISDWNDPKQVQEGWIFGLPDFDQSKDDVRDYILSYSRFWIEQTGVDGFRLDTVKHVAPDFFAWYVPELRKVKPDFWVIGEVWEGSPFKLSIYQDVGVTALVDFPVSEAARRSFAKDASLSRLADVVESVGRDLTDPWQMGGFLDNHDVTRFITESKDDATPRLKLGLTFLFTQRSLPIVYYGTEIAMEGGNDPDNRLDYPWGKEPNLDVRDLVTRLNRVRHQNIALRRGTVENLASGEWHYAYAREAGENQVVVLLNNHATESFSFDLDAVTAGLPDGTVLKEALTGTTVQVQGGRLVTAVMPRSGVIYIVETGGILNQRWFWVVISIGGASLATAAGWIWARRRGYALH